MKMQNEEIIQKLEADLLQETTRRHFFGKCSAGIGSIALASLLNDGKIFAADKSNPLAAKDPHFAPKAKRIIYLFMAGGPSQLELFDHKPKLKEFDGKEPTAEMLKGKRF
ncbi:MAG: hypothetical protein ACI814_003388, partial [Mariniblastus sp.]